MNGLFIPQKIRVGYQERVGTYTGKLAYVICYDEKDKLRKEYSWNNWRNKDIDPEDFKNEPTEGFVLNKKAGGDSSGWNRRNTYCRVYDPRGFEFEINIENLLYILENTNSINGKGLEGEFMYSWDGKDLILLPVNALDYRQIKKHNDLIYSGSFIKAKDLCCGSVYKNRKGNKFIYMGRYDYYDYKGVNKGLYYWFTEIRNYGTCLISKKSISKYFVCCESDTYELSYSDLHEKMICDRNFSPVDLSKNTFTSITLEEIDLLVKSGSWYKRFYTQYNQEIAIDRLNFLENNVRCFYPFTFKFTNFTIDEFKQKYQLRYKTKYLANGKIYEKYSQGAYNE